MSHVLFLLFLNLVSVLDAETKKPVFKHWQEMKYPYTSLVKGESGKVACLVTVSMGKVTNVGTCVSKSVSLKSKAIQNIQTWEFEVNEHSSDIQVNVVFKISRQFCERVKYENEFDVGSMTLTVKGWRKKHFSGSP